MSVLDSQQYNLSKRGRFLWGCCVGYSLKPELSPKASYHMEKDLQAQIGTVEGALSQGHGYSGKSTYKDHELYVGELTRYNTLIQHTPPSLLGFYSYLGNTVVYWWKADVFENQCASW